MENKEDRWQMLRKYEDGKMIANVRVDAFEQEKPKLERYFQELSSAEDKGNKREQAEILLKMGETFMPIGLISHLDK